MASMSMAASFLGGASTFAPSTSHRRLIVTNSVKVNNGNVSCENKQESNSNGRREIMFAAAAAAISTIAAAGTAVAEEPKRGTAAAKKAYAPVCVANPTAKICNY